MVLDCYLWRIGDRTWRGRASNACLDRMARELRREAKRNTAVVIHEIRSARESRVPIVRIGARHAFSPEGFVPVSSHAGEAPRWPRRPESERHALALLQVAALLHDLGKATVMFQKKLWRALDKDAGSEADPVRHELHSAVVWDALAGSLDDHELIARVRDLEPGHIDEACGAAAGRLHALQRSPRKPMNLAFATREGTIAHAVGMLILTHHRLPEAGSDHLSLTPAKHVRADVPFDPKTLHISDGQPFWHDPRSLSVLRHAADNLRPGAGAPGLDMALRASLMFADHLGSALKETRDDRPAYLANTRDGHPADPLDVHVERVLEQLPKCFDMLHRQRERYPALGVDQAPLGLRHPEPAPEPFAWQTTTAAAAAALCAAQEGGFFACLIAGTGTGKTRGAPMVLAAAAFADVRPERRYLRMTLALGLRALASQAAQDYVDDLRFAPTDVAVLIGQPPVRFAHEEVSDGAESALALPDWLQVERATGGVPPEGSEHEADWLRRLSHDTDRGLPATLQLAIEHAGGRGAAARRLVAAPIVVGTIDHLMGVATPTSARYLFQALRVLSADLILDEIDQYDPEDIAAVGRLIYQAAAGGRRVVAMSATLTADVAAALHAAYREGWRAHAAASGAADHVNVLCAGDAAGSCFTGGDEEGFASLYASCRDKVLAAVRSGTPRRRGHILPPCEDWAELLEQVDGACSELHDATATTIQGLRVSIGFVRMTRIQHAAALAVQLPAGPRSGRFRVKACLHARFPRLHRAYIEHELRRALNRKGLDPDAGLRALCLREGLLERARAAGCTELEIVLVTSPVIETGNDLDFDWAIVDPSSLRALVQAPGRVWRHRVYGGGRANVLILGRSPIVMADGRLVRPGVETPPHEETGVARVSLDGFARRLFAELAGDETFNRIDAATVLGEAGGGPLRVAEACLREHMLRVEGEGAPLGRYIRCSTVRLNLRMTRTRMFRRGTTRDLLFFQNGEGPRDAEWFVDLAPGTRQSRPEKAVKLGLRLLLAPLPEHHVFADLSSAAWSARDADGAVTAASDLQSLMSVRVPDYGNEAVPSMTYGEWTGFTRGQPDDLSKPYGKG